MKFSPNKCLFRPTLNVENIKGSLRGVHTLRYGRNRGGEKEKPVQLQIRADAFQDKHFSLRSSCTDHWLPEGPSAKTLLKFSWGCRQPVRKCLTWQRKPLLSQHKTKAGYKWKPCVASWKWTLAPWAWMQSTEVWDRRGQKYAHSWAYA